MLILQVSLAAPQQHPAMFLSRHVENVVNSDIVDSIGFFTFGYANRIE